MPSIPIGGGKTALLEGDLDVDRPLVILLHGLGGTSQDMTAPLGAYPGLAFNRTASYSLIRDEGWRPIPPVSPISPTAPFFADAALTSVTSWRAAIQAAGFSTIVYSQVPGPMAGAVAELGRLATALSSDPTLRDLRIVFVAHSRGGLIARLFLVGAPAAFKSRVDALITLHSPHQGSQLATLATTVDGAAARVQSALAAMGTASPGVLNALRTMTSDPAFAELVPGNPILTSLAASEPVPGVAYHTFGGNSTVALRLWANVMTPASFVPLPVPFPLFHWSSSPIVVGAPLDPVSFAPLVPIIAAVPLVAVLIGAVAPFAGLAPELANGLGDVLVTDARAHLPFSATRTTNRLDHLEALFDPVLQAQVVSLLRRFVPDRGTGVGGYDLASVADHIVPFDHTHSGRMENLIAYRPGRGAIFVLGAGAGGVLAPVFGVGDPGNGIGGYDLASPADRIIPFDFDHSGRMDHVVAYRPGTGTIWILKHLVPRPGHRQSGFVPVVAIGDPGSGIGGYDLASPADRIIPFDFDHTGRMDHLLLYRPGAGTAWILKNTNGSFAPVFQEGAPGRGIGGYDLASPADRIIPFDFDHSGRMDHLLLYRPGTGTVWILRNSGGAFTPVFQEGAPGNGIGGYDLASSVDRIIPFDFDHTGRMGHLLLYRPGAGTTWILKNTGGIFSAVFQGPAGVGIGGYNLDDPADRLMPFDFTRTQTMDHLIAYRPGAGIARVIGRDSMGKFKIV